MDQRTRKLMKMHDALHPRDDINRLYVSRKEGRRGLASIRDCIDTSMQGLENNIKKSRERLITAASNSSSNITNRSTGNRGGKKSNWIDIFQVKNWWDWSWENLDMPKKGKPQNRNEPSFYSSTTQHATRTNYIKAKINNTQPNTESRLCGKTDGTLNPR